VPDRQTEGLGEGRRPRVVHTETYSLHTEERIGSFIHYNVSACTCSYVRLYGSAAAAGRRVQRFARSDDRQQASGSWGGPRREPPAVAWRVQ